MRCKKHPADVSSSVGVCATCLRQRLFAIIAAQAQSQAQAQLHCRKSDPNPPPRPPPSFPRSVSPYISRRKSETATANAAVTWRFFRTPQVGPSAPITAEIDDRDNKKGKGVRLSSLFFGLFRSKSGKTGSGSDPNPIPVSVNSCSVSSPGSRKMKHWRFPSGGGKRIGEDRNRGMSPTRYSDDEDHGGSSGCSSESSHGWKRTPASGGKAAARSKNVSGLKFCLSPLVRASPGRHWNQKGPTSETVVAGEFRVPAKPYLSAATSFCKNRSRKLADFGRYD